MLRTISTSIISRCEVIVARNQGDSGLIINVELDGASKDSVGLDMGNNGFCLKAEGDKVRYDSCVTLGHEIVPEKAKAKFESGILQITVPFLETIRGHKVAVE